jgi:hypothetical protein
VLVSCFPFQGSWLFCCFFFAFFLAWSSLEHVDARGFRLDFVEVWWSWLSVATESVVVSFDERSIFLGSSVFICVMPLLTAIVAVPFLSFRFIVLLTIARL